MGFNSTARNAQQQQNGWATPPASTPAGAPSGFSFSTPTLITPRISADASKRPASRSTEFNTLIGAGARKGARGRPSLLGGNA